MYRKDIISEVKNICLARYEQIEDWNHDINHIKRVVRYCKKIAELEGFRSKDIFLAELVAWMHDLGRLGEEKGIGWDKAGHAEGSYRQARNIIKKYSRFIGMEDTIKLLRAIREHSNAILDHPKNIIAKCLQDGDRGASLNAIGLISMLDYMRIIEDVGPVKSIKGAKKKRKELLDKIKERDLKQLVLPKLNNLRIFYYGDRLDNGKWRVLPLHFETSRRMFKKGIREVDNFIEKVKQI